jgi:exosortase A-associated hydrolase 1
MSHMESPVVFGCAGERLIGVVAMPVGQPFETGVLIVVGGPQYRAGSHRQFTLLARDLAACGIASLRFDVRGMGDSEGDSRTFDAVDDDLAAAIDAFLLYAPTLKSMVLWGLCDAASAALIYAHRDPRVAGLILLNPWVHTDEAAARVRLKHYYRMRLMQPSFWAKLFAGKLRLRTAMTGLLDSLRAVWGSVRPATRRLSDRACAMSVDQASPLVSNQVTEPRFIVRMLHGLQRFEGDILFNPSCHLARLASIGVSSRCNVPLRRNASGDP